MSALVDDMAQPRYDPAQARWLFTLLASMVYTAMVTVLNRYVWKKVVQINHRFKCTENIQLC